MNLSTSRSTIKKICSLIFWGITFCIGAQEALKSTEEEYYDFLALQGIVERPTLNYRTLSDSEWNVSGTTTDTTVKETTDAIKIASGNLWAGNNLGTKKQINENIAFKIYGPEWYNSYNSASPYGQNDGGLWQGKGYNTSLTGGARLEAYGFEVTVKPQVSFSQNLDYDYITLNYSGSSYSGKADTYGYYGVASIDAPQRFGDAPFLTFDWGDTEIRYTWKKLTVGFGTQSPWLGPAHLNPIIHSNNAGTYPKFDLGLRKTSVYMPHFGWYLGEIEGRGWWGYLTESDYFDNDSSNDHNLITGMAVAWQLPFLKELTFGFNRTMLSKWNNKSSYTMFGIYDAFNLTSGGDDECDQRMSITLDYLIQKVGLNIYLEWGRNDFSPGLNYIIRYPFHTQGYTFGTRKSFGSKWKKLRGEIIFELTNLESSRDYDSIAFDGLTPTTFYAHDIITQGYTNGGQWLGAGIGTGGNSQYLGIKLYYPKGYSLLFFQRRNPDMDYTWFNYENITRANTSVKTMISVGIESCYFINESFSVKGAEIYTYELQPLNDRSILHRNNFSTQLTLKYNF